MAKQNVTFVERHAEKFVVGFAAAVLLGTIGLYGISTPNTVEVSGEAVGPKDFYIKLKQQAESARSAMRSKTRLSPPPEVPIIRIGERKSETSRDDYMAGVVPPGVPVPMITGDAGQGDLALAEILPPKAVTVLEGRANAALPVQRVVDVNPMGGGPPAGANVQIPIPTDYHWALIVAAVDRKAQREVFAKAGYLESDQQLVVARVEVERRQLQPDGRWSAAVIVPGYSERVITGRSEIVPETVDGQLVFPEAEHEYVRAFRAQLYSPDIQNEILRPAFQSLLGNPLAWQPPKTLPGFEFKLAEFGVAFPAETGKSFATPQTPRPLATPGLGIDGRGGTGRGPVAPPAGPAARPGVVDLQARKRARELLDQANGALKKEDYLKANELLQQVVADHTLPEKERKEAEDLLKRHNVNILQAEIRQQEQEKRMASLGMVKLGPDQEPLWVTDITVEPGQTYQYRVRLVAFNEFAGKLGKLQNPKDAERVLIEGKWSEWSEPVTICPAVQVFFTGTSQGPVKKAQVTVYQWLRGEWDYVKGELEVGQPVSLRKGRDTFKYDGIVAAIENGRQFRPRGKSALGPPRATDALTLVSASGLVEEHLSEQDSLKLREQHDRVAQEKKLLASAVDPGSAWQPKGGSVLQRPMPGALIDEPGFQRGGPPRGRRRDMDAP